ncbi:MAG: GNAT family N-acetyltransferase [Deltaproteobacteria bacterium]|nr:GNAT family N-acetyltransferase [Deltaproteobacteria bacterium]
MPAALPPDLVLRDMRPDDLVAVHALNQDNVPAVGEESLSALRALYAESAVALVAERGGRLVAFCLALAPGARYESPNYLYFANRRHDFLYIDRVAVRAGERGRGVGAALYRAVAGRASAPWLTLEVNLEPLNEGSLRFHAREGFVEVAREETRPGKPVCLMVKALGEAGGAGAGASVLAWASPGARSAPPPPREKDTPP